MSVLAKYRWLLALVLLAVSGCTDGGPTVDRVQPNLIDKEIFEGEWWVAQTVIDTDPDASGPTWPGDMGTADLAVDKEDSAMTLGRIRWVIDEKFLFAYRSFELVDGANAEGGSSSYRGQPLAAFAIEDHVDVRRQYNAVTGETQNIVEENTEDRRWFERAYMRVDWSKNHVQSFFFVAELAALGQWQLEDGQFFIQDGGAQGFPPSWEPQLVTLREDPDYRFAHEWPEGSEDVTHYMSFVTFMNLSPGGSCIQASGAPCQTLSIPHRLAFLRVPPNHQYAAATQSNEEYDKFGVYRTSQKTYLRADDTVTRRCDSHVDCGIGGFCNAARHVCEGGLGEDYGETDALAYLRPRHNLFEASLTAQTCSVDWECDGRFEDTPGAGGSVCDRSAKRCTIPLRDRVPRALRSGPGSIAYHLTAGFPKHLVRSAMEVVARWNEVFMRGWRAVRDEPLPSYRDARVDCQTEDPTRYCYCGSPDDRGGTCAGQYDPFVTPEQWVSRGVDSPYRCHVENTEHAEPVAPTSFDDYPLPQAYRYRFVGDECLFVLHANTCDLHRTDPSQACDEVVDDEGSPIAWEQLGDIRYQLINYVDQATGLDDIAGKASPLADPTTGELIVANASIVAKHVESMATDALEYFPVLRCANPDLGCEPGDEAAAERYLSGENLRGYFSRLGRTEHPRGLAASGSDGFSLDDTSRPALPVDVNGALRGAMARAEERIDSLRGQDGRAQILSDRMRRLAGTPIEQKLMGSLGAGGLDALHRHFDHGQTHVFGLSPQMSTTDDAILDQISPFRGSGFERSLSAGADASRALAARNVCSLGETVFRSRFAQYWAEAFRGRPGAEASLRMQQLRARMTLAHEMGHALGLRHNFAGSLDRDNYGDGYFRAVMGESGEGDDLPLPQLDEGFDLDDDGFLAGEEFDAYLDALREVRNERARRGVHNYTSSSIMDYNGDMADAQGIGRYDAAAAIWNHFDLQEAYDLRQTEGPVQTDRDGPFQGLARSHEVGRVWWRSYRGGESCRVDDDCPASAQSGVLRNGQPVYQRCVQNPAKVFPQEECSGQTDCVCSRFDDDVRDYADFAAYFEGGSERQYAPVSYLYCPDERTNDISWCNERDAGESFREVIDHYRRTWEEQYPLRYYRRFRVDGARDGGSRDMVRDAAKIYQHLFFRFNFEPAFTFNRGPLGFDDQFLASIDAMNWFVEIVNLPDEGSYQYDTDADLYRWIGEAVDLPGADVSLLPGQGFGMWTKYQDGYFGFFRPERAGVFYDKYYALWALAIRDWRLNFTIDERYFINFYDLFQTEMTELFGGIILQDETWFAPRLGMDGDGPVVQHMSWYRGLTLGECSGDGALVPCRGSQPEVYPGPAIEGTTNEVLRSWAAILALAQFPVYYDTTFEQRLLVFKAGSGAGFDIPDIQPDGSPTCVYGSDGLGAGHFVVDPDVLNGCDAAQDADYVVFESNRFRTPYVAVKVRPSRELNLEEEQVGFQLLRRLVDLQRETEALDPGDPASARKLRALQQGESFLEYLIELQTAYGISNFF